MSVMGKTVGFAPDEIIGAVPYGGLPDEYFKYLRYPINLSRKVTDMRLLNAKKGLPIAALILAMAFLAFFSPSTARADESSLVLPNLDAPFFNGAIHGRLLLESGLGICALGLLFGLFFFIRLKGLPVHRAMSEVSETIYETCKTYLKTQLKFILLLWVFIGAILIVYF